MSTLRNRFIGLLLLGVAFAAAWRPGDAFAAEVATSGWTDIAAGGRIILAVKHDGSFWAWGETKRSGAFGNGEMSSENPMTPVQVSGLRNVAMIAAGADHALPWELASSGWNRLQP